MSDLLYPKVVRKRDNLKKADIAIKRSNVVKQLPEQLYMAYIENDELKIATSYTVDRIPTDWEYQFTIAKGVSECAIEFDGHWEKYDNKRRLVTDGDPWVIWIDSYGSILAQQLYDESPIHLSNIFEGNHIARELVAMRGWKNIEDTVQDQGLIIAYTKTHKLRYRNLCEQSDGRIIWESEKEVDIFPEEIHSVGLFRGNDYRVGFITEGVSGKLYLVVTERNYGAMGLDDEIIKASINNFTISMTKVYGYIVGTYTIGTHTGSSIDYKYNTLPDENISLSIANLSIKNLYALSPIVLSINNTDQYTIVIDFDEQVFNMTNQQDCFNVVDSKGISWKTNSTVQGTSTRQMVLTCIDFHNAYGDLTVNYDNTNSTMVGEAGQKVDSFAFTFTTTGLVPDIIPPPVPLKLWNE